MKPTIGRIVHYQSYGTPKGEYISEPRAAIITEITVDTLHEIITGVEENVIVSLCIFNPEGLFFNKSIPYSEEPKPGHWSWPPKVK